MGRLHNLVVAGRVVNPEWVSECEAQIGIDDGKITAVKKQGLRGERRVEAAAGCLIFPGFIDIHVHLREDSSHEWDYKEDFMTGTAAAVHGGVTTVVDMPNTPLPGVNSERIRAKHELARRKSDGQARIDIFFYGAVTESNLNLNAVAEMQDEVVAYKIFLAETTGGLKIREETLPKAFEAVAATSKPATIHCDESELSAVERVLSAASQTASQTASQSGAKINLAHVSAYESLRLLKWFKSKSKSKNFYCEVTPHHLFFNETDALEKGAFLKMNPRLRSEENRRLLLNAFKNGEIDFLATDHAPHTKEEKAGSGSGSEASAPAGVPNLDTYGNFVAWLILRCGVSPKLISRVCSSNPARFLGLTDRGRVEVGKRANLTVLDLQKSVKIRSDDLQTKCGWSPFEGYEFPGAVKHTIFNGVVLEP